ncbi:hypothetical protein ONZ45_g10434 [Pleurotus djamor]|nr:hypothetical protein ONZ45_g10434 [Pleurotus djamor]
MGIGYVHNVLADGDLIAPTALTFAIVLKRADRSCSAHLDSSAPRSWTVRLHLTHPLIPICLHLLPAPTHLPALRFFNPMYLDFVGIIPIITNGLEYTYSSPSAYTYQMHCHHPRDVTVRLQVFENLKVLRNENR